MENAELRERIDRVIKALENIESALATLVQNKLDEQDRIDLAQRRTRELLTLPRTVTGWPWTPDTVTQGFLAARWLRRDGNVYAGGALRGVPGPNSSIRGGDDNEAQIDVPSGAPRV